MSRLIPPRAVIGPQTHVIIKGGVKMAFLPVIDPLPVRNIQAIVIPQSRRAA